MYRDGISESRTVNLNAKEFHAFEELIYEQLNKPASSEVNETKSPPPSLDDIQITDLCDRIKELESWREGVDPGQLHSQSPTANIISLQNRVTSIEHRLTDLSATVTQHKAEQDNLDKLASPRQNKAHVSTLKNRLGTIENRITTLSEAVALDKKAKYSRLENIGERLTYAIERITTLEETVGPLKEETVAQHKSESDNSDTFASISYRIVEAERRITAWSTTTMDRINAIENKMDNQGDE